MDKKSASKNKNKEYIFCIRCKCKVSKYYFTKTTDKEGNTYYPRCPNCGHWEDPE